MKHIRSLLLFFIFSSSFINAVNYIHSPATVGDDSPRYNFINTDAAFSVLQPKYFAAGSPNPFVYSKRSFPVKCRAVGYLRSDSTFASRFYDDGVLGPAFAAWPWQKEASVNGGDIYAQPQTSVSDLNSRIGLQIKGNIYKDFDIEGFFNGAFVDFNTVSGIFSFYYAYFVLQDCSNWFLIGSYWAPLGIQENLPHVVSYNFGAPFTAWSIFPQVMLGHDFGGLRLFLYAYNETYFGSFGPVLSFFNNFSGLSSQYQQQGIMPEYCLRAEYVSGESVFGLLADIKRLVPRVNAGRVAVRHEQIVSPTLGAYYTHANKRITFKTQTLLGSNGTSSFLLGGYAVRTGDPNNPQISRTYANLYYISSWLSIESTSPINGLQPGLFVGYGKELGSRGRLLLETITLENSFGQISEFIQPICYSIATNYSNLSVNGTGNTAIGSTPYPLRSVDSVLRISPRVWFYFSDNVIVGAELELCRAVYGYLDDHGRASINQEPVTLYKPTMSVQCYF